MSSLAPQADLLARALAACRSQFATVGVFSLVVNLLQLTVSLYMMQVFDRVLATRSIDTLLWLTLVAIAAIGLLALLEGVRSQIMQRVALWTENRVAPEGFARALEATLRGRPYRMEALRDLGTCRAWLSGPGALAVDAAVPCCTPATPQGVCCPPKADLPGDAPCCGSTANPLVAQAEPAT